MEEIGLSLAGWASKKECVIEVLRQLQRPDIM